MCDFGTPVGSYLSNISEMKSKGSDPHHDQQRDISFGYLTLKQPLIMLISKNKFLQPMLRSPKIKTCMNLNLGAQAHGFYLSASVPYLLTPWNTPAVSKTEQCSIVLGLRRAVLMSACWLQVWKATRGKPDVPWSSGTSQNPCKPNVVLPKS